MAFDPVTAAFQIGEKLLDRFFPDPAQKSAAALELAKMKETGELARMTNETETVKAYLADVGSARARDTIFSQDRQAQYPR